MQFADYLPVTHSYEPYGYPYHIGQDGQIWQKSHIPGANKGKWYATDEPFMWPTGGSLEPAKNRLKLLDLFCGAGGCAKGYEMAGFTDITGIDIAPQQRYPYEFIQGDALEYLEAHGHEYDFIHASPPCQAYSGTKSLTTKKHPELIEPTRDLLVKIGKPYVIENVPGARMPSATLLCGTMFSLLVERHRLFETSMGFIFPPSACCHHRKKVKLGRRPDREKHFHVPVGNFSDVEFAKEAMGVSWMTQKEIAQAIPPAYTEYIGKQMLAVMEAKEN